MNIIEKLGITPEPWEKHVLMVRSEQEDDTLLENESWLKMRRRTEPERERIAMVQENDLRLANTAPEMLKGLIRIFDSSENDKRSFMLNVRYAKLVAEKATGKTWEEIKELIA